MKPIVTITIESEPRTGKSTVANLIREMLMNEGWRDVIVRDLPPSTGMKCDPNRQVHIRGNTIIIQVKVK